jgi:hypothetical protein
MANELAHSKMATLWNEVAETTGMKMALSKSLEKYQMGSEASDDHGSDSDDNSNTGGSDREYIPQDYRFDVSEGIVSSDGDFEDLIDRMIPVNRGRSFKVLAKIDAKGLRDPSRRKKVADGFARDIANAVDLAAYQAMIDSATMVQTSAATFDYQSAIDAEVLMLNRGFGAYDKKLFLSNRDYAQVAKDLGQNQYNEKGIVKDALTRATIPNLATFDTMRSDYLLNLANPPVTALVITSDQSHTVATYDANGFYLDNRSMTLAVTLSTPTSMPVGTKFTIDGVNYLHPETRVDSGDLLTFSVVTTGTGSVVVEPALVIDGPYRNASAAALTGADVNVLNIAASKPSLFYTPESTVLVPGNLPVPADAASVTAVEAMTECGLPMRMTYTYDFHKEEFLMKGLIYFDVQVVYPDQLGIILSGQA